jgi:hypothetical protein
MGYPDDLEHTAALSALIDAWVRGWARRYASRRNRHRAKGVNRATGGREKSWLALNAPSNSLTSNEGKADG